MENFFKNLKNKALMGSMAIGLAAAPLATAAQETGGKDAVLESKDEKSSELVFSEIESALNGPADFICQAYDAAVHKLVASDSLTVDDWKKLKELTNKGKTMQGIVDESLTNETSLAKLNLINRTTKSFLEKLYQNGSPFSETPDKLVYELSPGYDLSIPEGDGRKIFNLVFSKSTPFDQVDEGGITEKDEKGFIVDMDPEFQLANKNGTIYAKFSLINGETESFYILVEPIGKDRVSYHFSQLRASQEPNASYQDIKKALADFLKK